MRSKKLAIDEKREQLRSLIPDDVLQIDDLNKATVAQLRKLQDSIEVAKALQQLDAEEFPKEEITTRPCGLSRKPLPVTGSE
jgi:hypothetical protein